MSVKKNLTVATLAALLAVPAFGATNTSHALHMSSTTAHAARLSELQNNPKLFHNPYRSIPENVNHNFTKNGHTFDVSTIQQQRANGAQGDIDPIITGIDGNNNVSNAQVISALEGNSTTNNQNSTPSNQNSTPSNQNGTNNANEDSGINGNDTNSVNTNHNNTNSTQYTSKNSLPQTGESNGNSKAMAMGAVALGASAGFMALSMNNKKRQEAEANSVSSKPTVDTGDDKSNDDNADDDYYHLIMAKTFASLREDLKKF